jgi:hypothetical protein
VAGTRAGRLGCGAPGLVTGEPLDDAIQHLVDAVLLPTLGQLFPA